MIAPAVPVRCPLFATSTARGIYGKLWDNLRGRFRKRTQLATKSGQLHRIKFEAT